MNDFISIGRLDIVMNGISKAVQGLAELRVIDGADLTRDLDALGRCLCGLAGRFLGGAGKRSVDEPHAGDGLEAEVSVDPFHELRFKML